MCFLGKLLGQYKDFFLFSLFSESWGAVSEMQVFIVLFFALVRVGGKPQAQAGNIVKAIVPYQSWCWSGVSSRDNVFLELVLGVEQMSS